jgi:ParB family transcriptional regulator, chromosome partitioning protein
MEDEYDPAVTAKDIQLPQTNQGTERDVPIGSIQANGRVRLTRVEHVGQLVASIKEVGLINRLTVTDNNDGTFWLVSGLHRLEALRLMEWPTVPVRIMQLDELDRILAECDENLVRFISDSQTAKFTRERKKAYEAKHPETRWGGARPASEQDRNEQVAKSATCSPEPPAPAPSFVAATAAVTGKSERQVRLEAERGEKVREDVLEALTGTEADKGANLDKLKAVPQDQQPAVARAMIEAAKAKAEARKAKEPTGDGQKVVRAARAQGGTVDVAKLAQAEGVDRNVAGRALSALVQAGEFDNTGKGIYEPVPWFEKLMALADDAPSAEEYKKGIVALSQGVFHGVSFTVEFE